MQDIASLCLAEFLVSGRSKHKCAKVALMCCISEEIMHLVSYFECQNCFGPSTSVRWSERLSNYSEHLLTVLMWAYFLIESDVIVEGVIDFFLCHIRYECLDGW